MTRNTTKAAKKKNKNMKYVEMVGLKGGVGGRLRRATRFNVGRLSGNRQPKQLGRDVQDVETPKPLPANQQGISGGVLVGIRKSGSKSKNKKICKVCGKRIRGKMM